MKGIILYQVGASLQDTVQEEQAELGNDAEQKEVFSGIDSTLARNFE